MSGRIRIHGGSPGNDESPSVRRGRLRAALLSILPAAAGPLTEQAQQAETELNAGNAVKALASIEAAFNSVWDATPLGFSEALFVTGKPAGFGVYDARATNVFRPDEDMMVYAEPFGFGYGRDGEGFKIGFDADFELRTAKVRS